MKMFLIRLAGVTLLAFAAADAHAQRAVQMPSATTAAPLPTGTAPAGFPSGGFVYGGEFETHLQSEMTQPSGSAVKGTIFADSEADLYANYSTWLSLYSNIHLERNRNDNADDYYPDANSFFRSEGLTMRQLFVALRPRDDISIYGGKIHPNFGSAWDLTPGNFYNFGSDYEQDERIGLGVEYRLPETLGLHNLRVSVETFFLDTSFLSNSLLSRPSLDDPTADRLRRYTHSQFGPSNTEGFDSYTVALRGGEAERGLTYQVSFTQEGTDDPAGRTEYGESLGAQYDPTGDGMPLGPRLGVTPFLEYTHFNNFGGTANLEMHYLIGGLTFTRVRWQFIVSAGLRQSMGATQSTDHQENISINYTVNPYLTVGGGANYITVAGRGSWSVGPSLNFQIAF
jgi:hypothetical protein